MVARAMIPSQPWRTLAVATMFRQAPAAAALSLLGLVAWVYGANIMLLYAIARPVFKRDWLALVAAGAATVPQTSLRLCRAGDEAQRLAAA